MVGESFIEVTDVVLEVKQPDATWTAIRSGRFDVVDAGRKQASTMKAVIPDMDGTLAGKLRAGREVRLRAQAKGEVAYRTAFTGTITDVEASPHEANALQLTCVDWWKRLARHRVTLRRTAIDVGDAVLLVLDGSGVTGVNVVRPFGVTLDLLSLDYQDAMSAIFNLMDRADADAYIDENRDLHFFPRASLASGLSVVDDATGTIRPRFKESDVGQATRIMGFGGNGFAEFYAQLAQGATKTVTSNAATHIKKRIDFPRPELARIILKLERVAGSTDSVEVAVQNDQAGAASGVDVVKATIDWDDIPDAITEVALDLPSHVVADTKPWLIIRGTGATGQKVGVLSGADDSPYAKAYYRFPVRVQAQAESDIIAEYGLIEAEVKNAQVTTRSEMLELVKAELARRKRPTRTGEVRPTDPAWLDAQRGRTVTVTAPIIGAVAATWTIETKTSAFYGGNVWSLTALIVEVADIRDVSFIQRDHEDRIRDLERVLVPTQNEDVTQYLTASDTGNGSDSAAIATAAGGAGREVSDRGNGSDASARSSAPVGSRGWSGKWGFMDW